MFHIESLTQRCADGSRHLLGEGSLAPHRLGEGRVGVEWEELHCVYPASTLGAPNDKEQVWKETQFTSFRESQCNVCPERQSRHLRQL